MRVINRNCIGSCFVVDCSKKLVGVLTDGDIRRAILKNYSLDTIVGDIIKTSFVFGKIDDHPGDLIDIINKHESEFGSRVTSIPIVDDSFILVDYFKYPAIPHFPVSSPDLNGNEFNYLLDAFYSGWISSTGKYLGVFEEKFSTYSNCQYGVAVSNGTTALHLALVALGIGEGDEVIVPDLTFAATINAVLHANATPVIVDIEEESWCICPNEIEGAITNKTKAIIPVHIYGQVCDMESILSISRKHNLVIIEDCAEAHGATHKGKKVGSLGDIGCFSFYGNKVLTTGEGGMCTTNSAFLNDRLRLLRDHGMSKKKRYHHEVVGFNYRMTNLQAAIGVAQLEKVSDMLSNRMQYEVFYKEIFTGRSFIFRNDLPNRKKITWLSCMLLSESEIIQRDLFIHDLKKIGVDARPFFHLLSEMRIYEKYASKKNTIAKKISSTGVCFPTYGNIDHLNKIKETLSDISMVQDDASVKMEPIHEIS